VKYQTYCRPAPPPDDASVYSLDYAGDYATLGNVPNQTFPEIPYVPYGVAGDVMPERVPPMEPCVTPDYYPNLQTWGWPVAPPSFPSYGDEAVDPEQLASDDPECSNEGTMPCPTAMIWMGHPYCRCQGSSPPGGGPPQIYVPPNQGEGGSGTWGTLPSFATPQSGPRLVARRASTPRRPVYLRRPKRARRKGRFGAEVEPGMGKEMVISALLGAAVVLWWRR
jgi:hypothetical protein